MITVSKKDAKESSENVIRRFNRRVQQSGVLTDVKMNTRFQKPISKSERRKKAIIQKQRRAKKMDDIRMGRIAPKETRNF